MQKTKRKIIDTAIRLLNDGGYDHLRLPLIASNLDISLGNLTYHFPKKEQIMEAIYDQFREELATITKEYKPLVDLEGLDGQIRAFYEFQHRFRFFYLDLLGLERGYPEIAERHHPYIQGHIDGIYQYLLFNVGSGHLQDYENMIVYEQLAHKLWMTVVFWPTQLKFRGAASSVDEMMASVWSLVHPYLTKQGTEYLKNILAKEVIVHSVILQ